MAFPYFIAELRMSPDFLDQVLKNTVIVLGAGALIGIIYVAVRLIQTRGS
jgi:hypothetical protein